ncbi:MAG: hypothetical protein ACPG8W_10025, partial [Candidatus Promineifilaceae bacterium]
PQIRLRLVEHWPAFYLGSIAADYQSMGDVPREVTHFYPVPMPMDKPVGWERLLLDLPALARSASVDPQSAVFLAAYAAHLHYDVVWYKDILLPFFWLSDQWEGVSRRERLTIHNVLLTYLDSDSLGKLPASAENTLASADNPYALPFIQTDLLNQWHNMIVTQLAPNAPIHTVEIYAERIGITPDKFAAKLRDDDWMQSQVFDRVPLDAVHAIFDQALTDSVHLINTYLSLNN